jgi:hypothetical protein
MTLNLQERHQSVSIPPGWQAPKFQFGQIVRWELPLHCSEPREAWGTIIGLTWHESDWVYEVLPSADCPLAVAYPRTWGTGDDIEVLPAHRLTLKAD